MKFSRMLGIAVLALAAVTAVSAQSWTPVQNVPNIGAGAMALLTDGRVLVHDESGNTGTWQNWWTLTPDSSGNYATGTWTQVASTSSSYGPLYFASAVLPDGRYIIEGGEYNNGNSAWTNLGAIYDPVANSWTSVNPPSGWSQIGDASSTVLENGTWMLGSCCVTPPSSALFNASNLTWTSTGTGKFDVFDEEGITLLPGGQVLDVDAYVFKYQSNGVNWELYNPGTGAWTSQTPGTPKQYWDSAANCGGEGSASFELGPAVLMPNGTVFQTGANRCAAGHTGVYTPSSNTWVAGPDFPGTFDIADGPAALEVNGNVVAFASPGIFNTGAQMFEWNGSTLTEIANPPNGPGDSSYYGHFLMLPTGQLMFTDFSNDVELLTSAGSNYTGWTPTVLLTTAVYTHGHTYTLFGNKFNGASQDSAYGDDFQDATNYPLVRLTNVASGHVVYARTHGINATPVQYGGPSYVSVDIPASIETGATNLQMVTNGIASQSYTIAIN
jgi:hypothetical protein